MDLWTIWPYVLYVSQYSGNLYAVDKGLHGWNVLHQLLLIPLHIFSRSVDLITTIVFCNLHGMHNHINSFRHTCCLCYQWPPWNCFTPKLTLILLQSVLNLARGRWRGQWASFVGIKCVPSSLFKGFNSSFIAQDSRRHCLESQGQA